MRLSKLTATATAAVAATSMLAISPNAASACEADGVNAVVEVEGKGITQEVAPPTIIGNGTASPLYIDVRTITVGTTVGYSVWLYAEANGNTTLQRGYAASHPGKPHGVDNGVYGEPCNGANPDWVIF